MQGCGTLWKGGVHFARVVCTLQGWDTFCKEGGKLYKGGVHFARVGYTFQGSYALCKGGVHFASVGYTLQGWW